MNSRNLAALLIALVVCTHSVFARADEAAQKRAQLFPDDFGVKQVRSPFELDLMLDLQVTLMGLTVAMAPMFINRPSNVALTPDLVLDPSVINGLDRNVVGNRSQSAQSVSDTLLYSTIALPHVANLLDYLISKPADGIAGLGKDSLVVMETLAVTLMLTTIVKHAANRPRPFMYDAATDPALMQTADSSKSFFSGHTSVAFAMATSYSYLFTMRHPDSPLVLPVWIGTHAMAGVTGMSRVLAGKHFVSDVLVGALVGSATGLLIPWLHTPGDPSEPSHLLERIRFTPTIVDGGFGVNAMLFW